MTARLLIVTLAVAGCARPPRSPPSPVPAAHAIAIGTPAALRDDAGRKIARRVRIAHLGRGRFERAGEADQLDELADVDATDMVRLVADTSEARVQVRSDKDDARMLLWIDRADLTPVVVKSHALTDAAGARGAVVRAGAPVTVVADRERGEREIIVDDRAVRVRGAVPRDVIGDVYDQDAPRNVEPTHLLAGGESIRAVPAAGAAVIATTVAQVGVRALAPAQGGWIEVEIDRDWMYVRGFVPSADLAPDRGEVEHTAGGATGYVMTDTDSLIVPAGACLYARPGGPVVGVTTAERKRYAGRVEGAAAGWKRVSVDTAWGLTWPAVHVPAAGFDRCPTS